MVARAEEWGPWIEHDGKGCPVPVGTYCGVIGCLGSRDEAYVTHPKPGEFTQWDRLPCEELGYEWVSRYRIRKPRGMHILEGLLEQIDAPKPVEVSV